MSENHIGTPSGDNMVPFGAWWRVKKSRNHWISWVRCLKIMKSGFNCTNLEQINSRKLLNILFKHISPLNDLQTAIIIPMFFPMISYDFPMISPHNCWNQQGSAYWNQQYHYNTNKTQPLLATAHVEINRPWHAESMATGPPIRAAGPPIQMQGWESVWKGGIQEIEKTIN